jgi:queuine tRNA-ribosyltransferase
MMQFKILHSDTETKARSGIISTSRGEIETPAFMPVGTYGTVKAVHVSELQNVVNAPVILGNAYHLYLRPGLEVLKAAGGLHKFIGWERHMLTDSGGYQVYSLAHNRKISDDGVTFQSHIDGSKHFISPEISVDIQRTIGADFIMAFDECTPYPCEYQYAEKSMNLTHKWLSRFKQRFIETSHLYDHPQTYIPIVQGSTYTDLRKISAGYIAEQEAEANAIGGLSVGEPVEIMYEITDLVCNILPVDKPRYLMGVGTPINILESVSLGIDMFDCVIPTRNARHGLLYTPEGIINIKNEKWKFDQRPINDPPMSFIDQFYSRSYLKHLVFMSEFLAAQIASINNLVFYRWLMDQIRLHLHNGDFPEWKKMMVEKLSRRL